MIEVYKVTTKEYQQLVVSLVEWSGGRWKQPRKLVIESIVENGADRFVKVVPGETIMFKFEGKELFRGTVFEVSHMTSERVRIVCYDLIRYLTRNEDVYSFSNVTLSDVFRRICKDFSIPIGRVANTGYVFNTLLFLDDTTLMDMLIKGINETQAQTNRLYYVTAEKGKLNLEIYPVPNNLIVLSDLTNILDYDYKESIEETATTVKVRTNINDQSVTATATDNAGLRQFGRLQHVEVVTNEINRAQLNERAKTRLAQKKGVKHTINNLNVSGHVDLVSANQVRVDISNLGLKKNMYIDTDVHYFEDGKHLVNLTVVDRNYVPTDGG